MGMRGSEALRLSLLGTPIVGADGATGPPAPPELAPEPVTAPPEPGAGGATAPPEPAQPGPGPWDLTGFSEDVRPDVDRYLRETVQPHITQIEQDAKEARELYNEYQERPAEVAVELLAETYGPDLVKDFVAYLGEGEPGATGGGPPAPPEPVTVADESQLSPDDQEALEWAREQRRSQEYWGEVERIKQQNNDPGLDADLLHPFVVSAEGDFDAAYSGYKKWLEKAGAGQAPPPEEAPPTTGGEGGTTPLPTKKKLTLDEAMQETLVDLKEARQREEAPPTVSSA